MTKGELKREAKEYAENNAYKYANDFFTCQEAYLAGAEPREERIEALEKENAELKEKLAEEYYYKTYPVTLNIGEEERKKKVTDIFLAGFKVKTQWHKDKYSHSEKDKLLPCGKVEGYYRVILYDNYKEPQIVRPETEIEFVGNQREHIIAWCEVPKFEEVDR